MMYTLVTIMLWTVLNSFSSAVVVPTTPAPVADHVGVVEAQKGCNADQIPIVGDAPWIVDNSGGAIGVRRPPMWDCGPNTAQ